MSEFRDCTLLPGGPIADIVTTATTGSGLLFSLRNTKFWPVFAILSQIYALFGVLFTSLYSEVVSKNLQISGMLLTGLIQHRFNGFGTTGFHICCNDTLPFK